MLQFLDKAMRILCLPGKIAGWLVLPLAFFIVIAIIAGKLGHPVLISWDGRIPFLGRALTVNSLVDFQWHFYAIIVLFAGSYALYENKHVSVDTFSRMLSQRGQLWLRLVFDALFLLPFCAILIYYGTKFAVTAWNTGEGSTQGGLQMRWVIKSMIPFAFGLMAAMGVLRIMDALVRLFFVSSTPDLADINESKATGDTGK